MHRLLRNMNDFLHLLILCLSFADTCIHAPTIFNGSRMEKLYSFFCEEKGGNLHKNILHCKITVLL